MFSKRLVKIFLVFLTLSVMINCKTNERLYTQILDPTYKSYTIQDEKGYHATFSVDNGFEIPVAIIINKIEMPIYPSNKTGNQYNVNVLVSSQSIHGYQPKGTDKKNGIIFANNGEKYYRPVNFVRQ